MSNAVSSLRPLLRVQDAVSIAGQGLGAIALAAIVVIYAYEIIMRYFIGTPTVWASDFVSFLLLISVFAVLPWLTRDGGNVAVTLLPDYLPPALGDKLLRFGFFISGLACLYVAYIGLEETLRLFERNTMTLTTVRVPRWPMLALITLSMLNAGLYFFRLTFRHATNAAGTGRA
ncbi:TRAP transporter small permease [Amorphus sp. 3PC139-8]|uniref:TRAP transporter small permease n=1 Tax=Amorphus sp. 3PC139-8 TaxID=2735676 RepID=UPI00345DBD1E